MRLLEVIRTKHTTDETFNTVKNRNQSGNYLHHNFLLQLLVYFSPSLLSACLVTVELIKLGHKAHMSLDHIMSFNTISNHILSCHIMHCIMAYYIISYYVILCYIMLFIIFFQYTLILVITLNVIF